MRPRDPRRLLERRRRARARVDIVQVPRMGFPADGGAGSKEVAEVTLPRAELEAIWSPEYLERLGRTYWSFLSRVSLGLLKIAYTEDSREVILLTRPFVLLRFQPPDYTVEDDGGTVTWRIDSGLLVASHGRGRGFLRLTVRRVRRAETAEQATVWLSSEVVNFYPAIAYRIGRFIYEQTQQRVHTIVTHAFLRSLANLELEPSRVGLLSRAARR